MIKQILNNKYINLVARIIVGGLFIFTAISKLADLSVFAKEIDNYNILPVYLINFFAVLLPWIELLCGMFLLAGIRIKANAIICIGLYSLFTFAIITAIIQGLNIDCGCHTKILSEDIGFSKILQNIGLLILSVYLFIFPVNKLSLESLIDVNKPN